MQLKYNGICKGCYSPLDPHICSYRAYEACIINTYIQSHPLNVENNKTFFKFIGEKGKRKAYKFCRACYDNMRNKNYKFLKNREIGAVRKPYTEKSLSYDELDEWCKDVIRYGSRMDVIDWILESSAVRFLYNSPPFTVDLHTIPHHELDLWDMFVTGDFIIDLE